MGSASELEYELLLARDLGYLHGPDHEMIEKHVQEVKQMITGFPHKLRAER